MFVWVVPYASRLLNVNHNIIYVDVYSLMMKVIKYIRLYTDIIYKEVVGVNPTLATTIINNLKINNNMKCPTCGKELGTDNFASSDERSMKEHGECFKCSIWRERLPLVGNPDIAIIDGTFYTIGNENDQSPFRGFGGDKFVINFKDGRQITTTNLWCGGEISEAWKPKFPDNADFDWQWKRSISGIDYLVPKNK